MEHVDLHACRHVESSRVESNLYAKKNRAPLGTGWRKKMWTNSKICTRNLIYQVASSCSRRPRHFSLTVGSCKTKYRLRHSWVTTVACFAAEHRALKTNDLVNMEVYCRKLCRQIVGPPPGTNWGLDWHDIDFWTERVEHFTALAGVKSWSQPVCKHYCTSARHVANFPHTDALIQNATNPSLLPARSSRNPGSLENDQENRSG